MTPTRATNSAATGLSSNERKGELGKGEATNAGAWDEFPNGRFGDIRSPAYGEIDGYGASLKIPVSTSA